MLVVTAMSSVARMRRGFNPPPVLLLRGGGPEGLLLLLIFPLEHLAFCEVSLWYPSLAGVMMSLGSQDVNGCVQEALPLSVGFPVGPLVLLLLLRKLLPLLLRPECV